MRSVDPDSLLLRMGEYDLGNESDEPYEFQVFPFAVGTVGILSYYIL